MDVIQVELTDNTKMNMETQQGERVLMPEFQVHPVEFRDIIGTVRGYVANQMGGEVLEKADALLDANGVEDLSMNVDVEDVKWWLKIFVSFVPGLEIEFIERVGEEYEELSNGDIEFNR